MTTFSISEFKSRITSAGGFARGHLFRCVVSLPNVPEIQRAASADTLTVMCKSTEAPSFTVGVNELHYMTRVVPTPGSRTYSPFSATFFATNDYAAYRSLAIWQKLIASVHDNQRGLLEKTRVGQSPEVDDVFGATTGPQSLYADITLDHYVSDAGSFHPVATYQLFNAFPTAISGLSFSHDDAETVRDFKVDFSYSHFDYIDTPPALPIKTFDNKAFVARMTGY